MDDVFFWSLISESVNECDNDIEKQSEWLMRRLSERSLREIFEFQQHLLRHRQEAYDGRLLAAAAVLDDMDDDDFQDFRVWLVSRGKTTFEKCLENPEALVEVVHPGDRVTAHEIGRVAARAYEQVAGVDEFDLHFQPALPPARLKNSILWQTSEGYADPARLRVLFPRLWERFGRRFNLETDPRL
jgi:hypothetical protein